MSEPQDIAPLTPADCDLTDFPFMPMDITRLFNSDFHAKADDGQWRAGVTLWLKSFQQVPAGSLPDDDTILTRLAEFGRDVDAWLAVREMALRGWVRCSDGRLYHPVVSEKALEAWIEKLTNRLSSGAGNKQRWGTPFDDGPVVVSILDARALLERLNPHSRTLKKKVPKASEPSAGNAGNPDDTTAQQGADNTGNPGGMQSGSQGEVKGSEGKGITNPLTSFGLPGIEPPVAEPAEAEPPVPAAADATAPRKRKLTPDEEALKALRRATLDAYAAAFTRRYGAEVVENAKTHSLIKQLVQRLGKESPEVAAFYVGSNQAYYVGRGHQLGALVSDAEKLRTEWATGRRMTQAQAQQADRTGTNADALLAVMAKRQAEAANGR